MYTIYKLTIEDDDHYYIGSTKNLSNRLYLHKNNCFNGISRKNYNYYKSIGITKENFYDMVKCETICICDETKKMEIENKFINLDDKMCLNSKRENQNRNDIVMYYNNNKEKLIKNQLNRYYQNKEKLKKYQLNRYYKNKYKKFFSTPENIILCNKM